MAIAKCNLCDDSQGTAFRVPWDPIGKELMQAHLDEHKVKDQEEAENGADTSNPE